MARARTDDGARRVARPTIADRRPAARYAVGGTIESEVIGREPAMANEAQEKRETGTGADGKTATRKGAAKTAAAKAASKKAAAKKTAAKKTAGKKSAGKKTAGKKGSAKRAAARAPAFDPKELTRYYRDMLLIRRFEEKAGQLYGMGLIGGFCHLYIGQEAVVTGMQACTKEGDCVITAYRDHGHMLATGMDPKGVMAELTGREGGYSKGKGGSMHMFSKEKNFYGGHGIVGAQMPLGTGIAFALQYRETDNVSLTYTGDGAMNQGQVYESFNMAALWKLPVVYIIENNKYGMGTSVERASASGANLHDRGRAHGIPGHEVDGMDVLAVKEAGEMAIDHCRSGKGPIILEMKTYRYRGHSMSDPAKYRSKEEVNTMRQQHDPIEHARDRLIDGGHASESDLKEIDKEVKQIVSEAADFAQESPEPDPQALWTDVLLDA